MTNKMLAAVAFVAAISSLIGYCEEVQAGSPLQRTFNDPTPTSYDFFGGSVALDSQNVLIGVSGDDTNGGGVGQAHLFDAATGALLRTFDDPTPTSYDLFGWSVALDSQYVLIGASSDDTNGENVGQAHLFDATTGVLLQTFDDPTPTVQDWFGSSVAVDGNNVLIGASSDDTNGENVGQAYLFDAATGALLRTFDDPTPTSYDFFSSSVAVDGSFVLIGAWSDDTNGKNVGQAYLFDATTGALLWTFDDPTPTSYDFFGGSVAVDGSYVLIGASGDNTNGGGVGQAHLFDATTGALLQTFDDPTPTSYDLFGWSVALDSQNVLIGVSGDDTNGGGVGQAHLFNAATGALLRTFDDPTPTSYDFFGGSVAVDGNNVLIGASSDDTNGKNVGQVHLFRVVKAMPWLQLLLED